MDSTLKQRLIGAAVLAALAIIFLPMLLKGPDVKEPDVAEVPLSMPATPGQDFETRELPLTVPEGSAPAGGVLGMAPGSAPPATSTLPTPDQPPTGASVSGTSAAAPTPAPAAGSTTPAQSPAAGSTTPPPTSAALPPKPAAADATQTSAVVAAGNYVVNIGSFSNLANANALAEKLRAANLPVTADRVTLASGSAMRLRVGPYADRAAAEAARLRSESVTGGNSKVIVLDAAPAPAKTPAAPATKPAVPAAPAATRPVTLTSGFAVQLSAPSSETDALALRDRARAQGFSAFVQRVETDAGVRYRVRVGPVADRSAAETLRDAVNSKLGSKGIVVANP